MEIIKKIVPTIFSTLILALLLLYGFSTTMSKMKEDFKVLSLKVNYLKQPGKVIGPGTVVSPSQFVPKKHFLKLMKEMKLQRALIKELNKKGYRPTMITRTKVVVKEHVVREAKTDRSVHGVDWKILRHSNGLLLGEVGYQRGAKQPWNIKLNSLNLAVDIVVARRKRFPDRVGVKTYFVQGSKRIPATISNTHTVVLRPTSRWGLRVSPQLTLGAVVQVGKTSSGGVLLGAPWLELQRGEDGIFRWITPVIGYSNGPLIGLNVMSYNLGTVIPIIRDLWLSAGVGYHFNNGVSGLIMLTTTL